MTSGGAPLPAEQQGQGLAISILGPGQVRDQGSWHLPIGEKAHLRLVGEVVARHLWRVEITNDFDPAEVGIERTKLLPMDTEPLQSRRSVAREEKIGLS